MPSLTFASILKPNLLMPVFALTDIIADHVRFNAWSYTHSCSIQHVYACCCFRCIALVLMDEKTGVPQEVIERMVLKTICNHNLTLLSRKRVLSYFKDLWPRKSQNKLNMIGEELISVCWMNSPIACFPDKSFEHSFRIKRGMVDIIIYNLAKDDIFWRHCL